MKLLLQPMRRRAATWHPVGRRVSARWHSYSYSTWTVEPRLDWVDARFAPSNFVKESAIVYPSVLSDEEASSLQQDISIRMKRRRYEKGHWDAVITGYKEVELPDPDATKQRSNLPSSRFGPLSNDSETVLRRVRTLLESNDSIWMPSSSSTNSKCETKNRTWLPCHAIDLNETGELTAHVDSIKFSGCLVSGLSLLSPSILRLKPAAANEDNEENENDSSHVIKEGHVDLYLPPKSLYVLSGVSRYQYTHELLPTHSTFGPQSISVPRGLRYSVIFRDAKDDEEKE
eukprot:scaffold9790_cov40-Attheya_sp.AAC.1